MGYEKFGRIYFKFIANGLLGTLFAKLTIFHQSCASLIRDATLGTRSSNISADEIGESGGGGEGVIPVPDSLWKGTTFVTFFASHD